MDYLCCIMKRFARQTTVASKLDITNLIINTLGQYIPKLTGGERGIASQL